MDMLEALQQKREVHWRQSHPMASLPMHIQYSYCFGLAVLAMGNMKTVRELSAPYHNVCNMIGITKEQAEGMIAEINDQFDASLNQFVQLISIERRWSYCFMIDLLKMSAFSSWGKWYCEQVIEQFQYILKISPETMHFMEHFLKESENYNSDKAHELVALYEKNAGEFDYELLRYMNPEYEQNRHYSEWILDQGGIVRIEMKTEIDGNLVIKNGTKVIISNTNLYIGGAIIVDGGRLEILHSNIENIGKDKREDYMIKSNNQHEIKITHSTFQMHYLCGGIHQSDGNLIIKNSMFYECDNAAAVLFEGHNLVMTDTVIKDSLSGGVKVTGQAKSEFYKCKFENCRSEHGGGIYISSMQAFRARECTFEKCFAKFLGSAIYVHYKVYGHRVASCTYIENEPDIDQVFNVYEM